MKFRDVKGSAIESPREYNWRPAVYGVLIEDGKILIMQPNWDDKYCLPGGAIELGENLVESLEREFFEETGYSIRVNSDPIYIDSHLFGKPESDLFFQRISIYYQIERVSEEQSGKIDKETVGLYWKKLSDLSVDDFTFFQQDFLRTILGK
ncbi:NUDIX domain-containing protein [Patescibacteria group bacterium]